MLNKLALRNVKRSFKDYLIYIITVTISFSLIFAFNLISFSDDLQELTKGMENFKYAIMFVSVIVIFVIGWLINYTMNFMFEKRSKEFGTYMLLGIEKKDINKMFLTENIILGLIASVISFFGGILISVLLTSIVMNVFEMPYKISLSVNYISIILSFGYFVLIYVYALYRRNRQINKMKIYDMLYYEKTNEQTLLKQKNTKIISFILSIIVGVVGVFFVDYSCANFESNGFTIIIYLFIGIVLKMFSIYGITFTFSDFILNYVLKRNKLKYKNDNLFITRNFTSKVRTMGTTLGTLSLLTSMTFICMILAFVMKDAFENNVYQYTPYDIIVDTIYSEFGDKYDFSYKLDEYREYIKKHYTIVEEFSYDLYMLGDGTVDQNDSPIQFKIKELDNSNVLFQNDILIKLSDYNKLQELLGRTKLSLNSNEYFIHGAKELKNELNGIKNENYKLNLKDVSLILKDVSYSNFSQGWGKYGTYFIIVVPDEITNNLKVFNRFVIFDTKESTTEEFYEMISNDLSRYKYQHEYYTETIDAIRVKGDYLAKNRSTMTIFSFSFLYLSLIFIAVVGTILAIQTLSDGTKYKYRYSLLKKIGVDEDSISKTIRKQVSINFIFPIIYPIIIAIISSISINKLLGSATSMEYTHIYSLIYSLLIFSIVYFIYYLATYFRLKKDVEE